MQFIKIPSDWNRRAEGNRWSSLAHEQKGLLSFLCIVLPFYKRDKNEKGNYITKLAHIERFSEVENDLPESSIKFYPICDHYQPYSGGKGNLL